MSTKLNINYLRVSDLRIGTITKIIVSADRVLEIKCHDDGGQILNNGYDFTSAVSKPESCESPNGYNDLIYRYQIEDDDLTLWIACVVPSDTKLPLPDYQEYTVNEFPTTIFLAEGTTDVSELITNNPSWVSELSALTYPEKQRRSVNQIKEMLIKKEEDIERSSRTLDLNPELPKHVGYWWRSAVAVIKMFFQDSNTDPLIVAEMAKQAAAGPTTRDDQLTLLRNLNSLIARFPNGPDFAAVWVETQNLTSPSDVRRKTMLQVLSTRGTAQDETYDLPSDFDSTDESWIVENQPGIVTYDNDSPATTETIQATLTDYDGGLRNVRYRWQGQAEDGTWSDMSGRANRQRTWTIDNAGTYRCRVLYHDNYADDQEAIGAEFTVS